MDEQVLTEINISSVRQTTLIRNRLRIDRQSIIILVPETNIKVWDEIYNTGLLINNCEAIISPSKKFTIGRKRYNAKLHQLDLRKQLIRKESPGKKLRVITNIPMNLRNKKTQLSSAKPSKKYYFYDASIFSQATKYMGEKFSERMVAKSIFNELSLLYNNLKSALPTSNIEVMFLIKNPNGEFSKILRKLYMYLPEKEFVSIKFFDNFVFGSTANDMIIPLAYKVKGNNKLHRPGLDKFMKFLDAVEIENEIKGESLIDDDNDEPIGIMANMVKSLKKDNIETSIDNDGNVNVGLSRDAVSSLLKKHKINDPDIAINIKAAIDAYIKEKGDKLTSTEAEHIALKAINFTIHGTDEVKEEYINKPELLFRKLKGTNTHRVALQFPDLNYLIDPKSVIDISYTTGQHRQKFEFENTIDENVRSLFKSIEDVKDHPIKIKKVEREIQDNIKDRFINYTVTLQNLTGENKKPYKVELKVPSPVNDKYFKIHGSSYIIASQQFMKPVTKTDKNDVRILSNYAIIKVGIKNLKFNPSDVDDIIDKYITLRYPNLIKSKDDNSVIFKDDSVLFFSGETVYTDKDQNVVINPDTGKLFNQNGDEILLGKSEYQYEMILKKIQLVNPEDSMYRSKKSIPYIYIYLSGYTIPIIFYYWAQKGLLSTLNEFGIDYEMSNTDQYVEGYAFVKMADNQYLAIKPKSTRDKLITNGLLVNKMRKVIPDLNDTDEISQFISSVWGSGSITAIHNMTENMIDPVTKELLEFENLPTKLPNLISQHCVPMLLNKKADSLADLKIYRSRMSEMVLQSMYKQIKQAHNEYKAKVNYGDTKAEVWLDKEYIIRDMITEAGVLQHTEPVTPVDEIMLASRVIKSGKGGVRSKQLFKAEQRNIHPSQYGIISANSTPEGANVGIINRHTLTPPIVNKYGSYGAKDISGLSGWDILAIEEALVPFQNEMDSDRLVMAATHQGQVTPIDGSEAPLVGTGAEFIVPQLSSSRFCHKAKFDGKMLNVDKNKTITVKYKNGNEETFDITPRLSRTKMGAYISLEMTALDEGSSFKKDQIIAFTKNFTKDSRYASGKNAFIAVVNPMGFGHEDAYCIGSEFANDAKRDIVKEVAAIIPPDTKIISLTKEINKELKKDDVLLEFVYQEDLNDYLELNNLIDTEDEEIMSVFGAGDNSIKLLAPHEGEIIDVKVYINNRNLVDPQIVRFHKNLVDDKKQAIGKLAKSADNKLKAIDNIDIKFFETGGHKFKQNEFQGARVVYYVKQQKPLMEGDKIANRSKGRF
jgi:hypothetical protein